MNRSLRCKCIQQKWLRLLSSVETRPERERLFVFLCVVNLIFGEEINLKAKQASRGPAARNFSCLVRYNGHTAAPASAVVVEAAAAEAAEAAMADCAWR